MPHVCVCMYHMRVSYHPSSPPSDPAISLPGNCSDGKLRLVNGSDKYRGRVEVCINNAWGTICDNGFDSAEAEIICSELGFDREG